MDVKETLAIVNGTSVSPELLSEALDLEAKMSDEDKINLEKRAAHLTKFLMRRGFAKADIVDLVVAINFRWMALMRFIQRDHLDNWMLSCKENGEICLHPGFICALAKEPLIEDKEGPAAFDVDSLKSAFFELVQVQGCA